ncbi:MAG: PAS domain-containing protein [Deltaproteobacteria bacterium]|nr:PAS domain-containing protein [Deltaproteobacteria bacterium]
MTDQPTLIDSHYLTVLDSVDAVIYVADMETHELLFLNKLAREVAGGSIGSICWKTLQANQQGPCSFCTNDRLLDKHGNPTEPYVWEVKNTLSGEWWECRDQAIRWSDGRLVRLEIATHISERKRNEESLHDKEQRFRELFENMSSGVAIYDATADGKDFIFKNFNSAAEKIENIKREKLIGHRVTDIFPGVKEFGLLSVLQRVWKTGVSEKFPMSIYQDKRIQGWRDNYVFKLPSEEIVAIYDDVTLQKQAEQELLEKKERLSFALQGANTGMWDWNLKTGSVYFDENYFTMAGYEPDEFPHDFSEWEKRIHPDDVDQVKATIQSTLEQQKAQFTAEFRFKTKTEQWMWILAQGKIIEWDDSSEPVRFAGLHTGIEKIKESELALRESEERLELTLEAAELGSWDWNPMTGKVVFNQRWTEMLGYRLDELKPHVDSWTSLLHPDDLAQTMKNITAHLDGQTPVYQTEFRMRTKSGEWKWILDTGKVTLRNDKGQPLRMTGTHQDISDRKKADEALRTSEENLRITLNSIGDAVIATDIDHQIIRMNPIAEQLTGWTETEAISKPLKEVFHIVNINTGKLAENPAATALKTGKTVALANHTMLISKDGHESQIADSAAPIRDKDGHITGVVLVFRDVTEEYRIREELQKMQQLESIGTLAGGIAHDFNNILAGIFGNIALAKKRAGDNHPCSRYLDQAEISANRAKNLTGQLLTFAKGGEPIKGHVSLGELIKEVATFDLSGSNVKLHYEEPDDLWLAQVDSTQIQQVISNLVINATQAMPDGGHLDIKLKNTEYFEDSVSELKPGKYIEVKVRDEGAGIAEKYLPRIFDPYFSTKQTGRGLGLATVYSVISRHGGQIHVQSKAGEGTVFTFYLPAIDDIPTETDGPKSEAETVTNQPIRVLVMDDEEIIRLLTTEMIIKMGGRTDAVTKGEEALEAYTQAMQDKDPYDLVIMDLTIPGGMGGKEAMRNLLQIDPEAKVIVSSGYADDPVMALYKEHGFKGIAAKPYTLAELKKTIDKIMDG